MTVTLTYDGTLARVRITATALAAADYATVERSTDNVRWTTVRGGVAAPVAAGALVDPVDDYEFIDGVPNYYRVRGVESGAITFVGHTNTVFDANAAGTSTLAPTLPVGLVADGDLMVLHANIRNSGTGTVNTPAGWTLMLATGNVSVFGRRYVTGDLAPTVSFTGGVANATVSAKIMAWRRADLTPVTSVAQLNGSAQNVAHPALTVPADDMLILAGGWKQNAWTSVAPLATTSELQDATSALGDDASAVLDYVIQTAAADFTAASFVVTGGSSAISRGWLIALQHAPWLNSQTASLTPDLDGQVWLKSVTRPFLNRAVAVLDWSDIGRPDAGTEHDVVGRSLPIATTGPRGSRTWTLPLRTGTPAERQTMDYVLASGDVLFVHVPAGREIPGGYVVVHATNERRPAMRGTARVYALPVREVAPPGPDVVAATATWDTVLAAYATWADVLAANPTWADLLTLIGDPSEVIVA